MLGFPLLAVVLVVAVVILLREPDPERRATILKKTGFGIMAVSTLFFGLFVVGETVTDPGGWEALGLVAAWAIPFATLTALAWFRPTWATWLFAVLIAGVIGVSAWFALDPDGWRAFEDRNGPVRDVATFVLAAGIALLGLKRTAVAGWMLLVLGIAPIAIMSLESLGGVGVLLLVTSVPFVAGALYVLSARMAGRSVRGASLGPEGKPTPA